MHIYQSLGVRRVVNAQARLTRLGGSLMPDQVLDAMREAATWYVDIFALQRQVGERLATLTRNEAAYVCTGASAGLFLSTLACMVGSDLHAIAHLPDVSAGKDEVIMHRAHRIPYDPAIQLAGARLVEVGNAIQTFPWEFEAAISERTAAIFYVAGEHLARGALSLTETVHLAHAHAIPVIVDAAAQLPPPENLWRFTRDLGADLTVFSGGKDLRGPQASGLIVGRADLIDACYENGAPHQRLGRPMKVGKEEMIGLLAAVEHYLQQDHAARRQQFEATVEFWVQSFVTLPGVTAWRDFPNEAGQPIPRVAIQIDPAVAGMTAAAVCRHLWEGDPAIAVEPLGEHSFFLTPDCLEAGEEMLIVERVQDMLAAGAPSVTFR